MSNSPGINNSLGNPIPVTSVKTSKKWVLPPRPKPGRKPTNERVEVCKEKKRRAKTCPSIAEQKSVSPMQQSAVSSPAPSSKQLSGSHQPSKFQTQIKQGKQQIAMGKNEIHTLNKNVSIIDEENCQLKTHLLSLIHDYKHLKHLVLNRPQSLPHHLAFEDATTTRKRSFTELVEVDPMNELICNMNDLSYCATTPNDNFGPSSRIDDTDSEIDDVLNYINLDDEEYDEDEDIQSSMISRTTSPSAMSETDGENSLMSSLTRSTTVSTNNSTLMTDKKISKDQPFKFYNLPEFSTTDYEFTFDNVNPNDKMMSIIHEDKYNMITDFLEEKLIDNDLNYYVQNESFKH